MDLPRLRELATRRAPVRIQRNIPGVGPVFGFVVAASDELILVRDERDLRLGGFSVYRVADVKTVRSNWIQRFHESVLRRRGELAGLDPTVPLDLTDLASLFRSLEENGIAVVAETEYPHCWDYLDGEIDSVNGLSVRIRWPSRPRAQRAQEPRRRLFQDITRVAFAAT